MYLLTQNSYSIVQFPYDALTFSLQVNLCVVRLKLNDELAVVKSVLEQYLPEKMGPLAEHHDTIRQIEANVAWG